MDHDAPATSQPTESSDPYAPVWRWVEWVGGAVFSPGRTFREVGERQAILPAIVVVLLVSGLSAVGQLASLLFGLRESSIAQLDLPGQTDSSFVALELSSILGSIVTGPVFWTIAAGAVYGTAYLLGGRGAFMSLWAATGFALVPQFLIAPLNMLTELSLAFGAGWQLLVSLLAIPFYVAAFIWTLVLFGIAVRETMNLTSGRAFASVGLLVGGLLLLGILLICAVLALIIAIAAAVSA